MPRYGKTLPPWDDIARELPEHLRQASAAQLYEASQAAADAGDLEAARRYFDAGDLQSEILRRADPEAPQPARPLAPQRRAGGRPRVPDHERTKPHAVRLNAERWDKLKALGTDWLEAMIDATPDPRERKPVK